MTGPLAQIIALTCHGNASLERETVLEFSATNFTCQFCEYVEFVEIHKRRLGKPSEVVVAKTPEEWFAYLKRRDAQGLRLVHRTRNDAPVGDRLSAGFVGGGGDWFIEIQFPGNRVESWMARWEVGNQSAPGSRIWRVTYGRVAEAQRARNAKSALDVTYQDLLRALREIHAFSEKHKCGNFTNAFAEGIRSLTNPEGGGDNSDLAPRGCLPPKASAMLEAVQSAWVFGGMGSWNDMGFGGADGKEYDRVSEQLHQRINEAICEAVNAGLKERGANPSIS